MPKWVDLHLRSGPFFRLTIETLGCSPRKWIPVAFDDIKQFNNERLIESNNLFETAFDIIVSRLLPKC